MDQKPWRKWTDEEVHQALAADWGPQDRWRIYGYVDNNGMAWAVMDDDDERYERVTKYLKKIGTPSL